MPYKIFIIACEPSGDLHGAALADALRKSCPDLECRGLGGPKMQAAGVGLLHDMTTLSALGLGDVVRQYFTYRKIFYRALDDVNAWRPDAIVLIDSPAFNLRFAKKIKRRFPVIYYISPQIWAWAAGRIRTIQKTISKMLTILPFETSLYEKAGVPCEFVGHPLLDHIHLSAERDELRRQFGIEPVEKMVGLLPGSRESEVRRILPLMLETACLLREKIPATKFFLIESSNVPAPAFETHLRHFPDLAVQRSSSRFDDLLCAMDFALIASGTATLEAALVGTPFFLFYKASGSTYFLGKHLIRVPFLGMVNLLAGKKVVPEFIQQDIRPAAIAEEARKVIEGPELGGRMKEEFAKVRGLLGEKGASKRAAQAILDYLPLRHEYNHAG